MTSAQTSGNSSGVWLVLAAAILWGTTGTAQALAPAGAQPQSVGAVRLAIGGLALLVIALARGSFRERKAWPWVPTLMAGACMAAYQPMFFAGVARTGVAVGTVVAIGSSPILAGLLAWWMRGERPGARWAAATGLAVTGCALLTLPSRSLQVDPLGILLALGAGAAYALYATTSKRLVEHQPPEAVAAVVFCLGAVLLSPLLLAGDLHWLAEPRGWGVALHLGLITTAVAYSLYIRGLRALPVADAVTLSLGEPLTAGVLGVVALGERLTLNALAGIALVFAGLLLLTLQQRRALSRRG